MIAQGAFQKYQFGKIDEARDEYKRALKTAPNFASIYRNWAVMEYQENNIEKALKLIKEADKNKKNDPQILLQWGNILKKSRDYVLADEKYLEAVELASRDPIVLSSCGTNKSRLKEYKKADELLQCALQINQSVNNKKHESVNIYAIAENLIFWSLYYIEHKEYDSAISILEKANRECEKFFSAGVKNPDFYTLFVKINHHLGDAYYKKNDKLGAKLFLLKLKNVKPNKYTQKLYRAKGLVILAKIHLKEGRFTESVDLISLIQEEYSNLLNRDDKYASIKNDINEILNIVGESNNRVTGEISYVNIDKKYLIITCADDDTYIAGPTDMIGELTFFNQSLTGYKVEFTPNITGDKKKSAKMVKKINR